jgi:hypothetical protein
VYKNIPNDIHSYSHSPHATSRMEGTSNIDLPFDSHMTVMYSHAQVLLHTVCKNNHDGVQKCLAAIACAGMRVNDILSMSVYEILSEGVGLGKYNWPLSEVVPNYISYMLDAKYEAESILACASVVCDNDIMWTLLSYDPEIPDDMDVLFILEHSEYTNFRLLCDKYGDLMVNRTVSYELGPYDVCAPFRFRRPGNLMCTGTSMDIVLESLSRVTCIDMVEYPPLLRLLSCQLEKLRYLVTNGSATLRGSENLLERLVIMNNYEALDNMLSWGLVSCRIDNTSQCIQHCLSGTLIMTMKRILSHPTFVYVRGGTAHHEVTKSRWTDWTSSHRAERMTRILVRCNFLFIGIAYNIHMRDCTDRITMLYRAGAIIQDLDGVIHRQRDIPFDGPHIDTHQLVSLVQCSAQPRSLQDWAVLAVKTAVGPCQYGQLSEKMEQLPLPSIVISMLTSY